MRKLVLVLAVAFCASQAAGCIFSSGDDDDVGDDAAARISWTFKDIATNQTTTCPTGFDTAVVIHQEVDSTGHLVGQQFTDKFDCSAGEGTVTNAPGVYNFFVVIQNGDNMQDQYATSLSETLDLTAADKSQDFLIANDGGYFQFGWSLRGASTNAPLDCAQVADLRHVEIVSTVSGGTAMESAQYNCDDLSGVTPPMLNGSYTVSVAALNGNNAAIGTAPTLTNKTIGRQNDITDLGSIEIPITGL